MLRVLTLSTLFPDASRPNFGVFVEKQTLGLAAHPDVELRVVAPVGLPPFPLSRLARYAPLAAPPATEQWKGLEIHRPRFPNLPGTAGRWHAALLARTLTPLLTRIRRDFPFDVIDAEFFFPDGPAAVALGRRFGVPASIKARGADIHHWGTAPATAAQVQAAGRRADGLLAVSQAMADDMVALGMPRPTVHSTGIDRSRFGTLTRAAAKAQLGVTGRLVVSLGALIPRKGHAIVAEAVSSLPGVTLWIVGEGPERPRLEALIAGSGAGDRIRLLGAVPHDKMATVLAAADVMALASSSEGLANAWVEALASGTPIVIPDAGGAREVVTSPAAGRIVARTPAAFAEAIAALLANPPAADAVQATVARFSWESNRDALYAHLQALVAKKRAQSSG
ncbi:glycosyltransferase [Sphingomonas desiccabilis]|uniref:Glycosyltransferase family 4 protein n=1 Tax=Sphingomonas desiccabilis TaxID=429134 RepID=A0A4V1QPN0_9SPHN|nr:glycosyltransferase [Sphingomonas desiccabilis]MBB3909668.1 glycosyltransferase involved in cell wall biosynthesis [Sphingomonas desiccabilis]RXZ34367.1 glycosyltransferase family 4 protein [Sphingomonas desiccabilis]